MRCGPMLRWHWYYICQSGSLVLLFDLGGLGYVQNTSTNLMQAMYADPNLSSAGFGWVSVIYILFPFLTYITSIPVAMIVSRLNFVAAKILTPSKATFWSVHFPFIVGIPFQTGSWITVFGDYTSLSFQSLCNFIAPFLIYLFL